MTVSVGNNLKITYGSSPTVIADIESYTFDDTSNAQVFASSSTSGQMSRVMGTGDSSGSFTLLAEKAPTGIAKGVTLATFSLISNSAASGTTATLFGPASVLITDIAYTVDPRQIIKAVVKWGQV